MNAYAKITLITSSMHIWDKMIMLVNIQDIRILASFLFILELIPYHNCIKCIVTTNLQLWLDFYAIVRASVIPSIEKDNGRFDFVLWCKPNSDNAMHLHRNK